MEERIERRRAELDALADQFEALLLDLGIKIPKDSKLEQAMILPRRLKWIREEDAPLPDVTPEEEDDMFRRVAWLWGVIPRVLEARRHDDFAELVSHLERVVAGEFAQNVPGDQDEDSDKLFELVVALALLPSIKRLKVDTGKAAARNPDLLFDFNGKRWGIACKALYTAKPERYRDSVIKGASQIEKSEAECGAVCISLRNLINQSLFMPRKGTALESISKATMRHLLAEEEERLSRDMIEPVAEDLAADFSRRPKVRRGVLHVSAGCARTGSPDDVRMTYFAHVMTAGRVDDALEEALNAGLQAIQPPL